VSELRSVVDAFRAESLPELPDARIEEDFAELHQAIELLEVERLRRLAEIDRRRIFERRRAPLLGVMARDEVQGRVGDGAGTGPARARTRRDAGDMFRA
jgi:hypothetical protein